MPTKAPDGSAQLARKTAVIDDIKARLDGADAAVLTEYRGLTVSQIADLRAALRPAATDYKIFKNTLAKRAAKDVGLEDLLDSLTGPVAIAFVRKDGGDAVTAAKALRDFAKANENLILKGGLLGIRVLSSADIEALADVPPREQLLARLAGGFQAPMTKAAGLFQAFTRNFAYGIKAYVDQRVEAGEALETPQATETEQGSAEAPAPTEGESDGASAPSAEESRDTPDADEAAAPSGESDQGD
jgi:large subunit ribosomal protein L10